MLECPFISIDIDIEESEKKLTQKLKIWFWLKKWHQRCLIFASWCPVFCMKMRILAKPPLETLTKEPSG